MANKKRNVVVIICDQLRPDFIGPYGCDFIRTPNIDALAENGCTFDNAITASTVCAPARGAMLTGRNVSGHGAWTNDMPFNHGVEFLPARMKQAGYMTAEVGCFDHKGMPFDYINNVDHHGKYLEGLKAKHPDAKVYFESENGHFKYPHEDHYDRISCDMATDFIESYAKNGTAPDGTKPETEGAPFFLYCGFLMPHMPYAPSKGFEDCVDADKIPPILCTHREDIAPVEKTRRAFLNSHEDLVNPEAAAERRKPQRFAYCEMIAEIDSLVGRIVQSLKDNGIYEDTTIIFSADHGSVEHDYNVVSKGPWPYRSQLFIPMIVSNNPRLENGSHCDALCGNLDIGATALDCGGDDKAFGVARSLIGLADGTVCEREVNMSEFCDSCKTLVDKQYTFTYYPFTGETALYDRINDPEERINLGGKPEYKMIERKFLMDVIDFMCLAKGVRIEAHDLVREVKEGIEKKHPNFLDNFEVCYPLSSWREVERLEDAGLDATYNEFIRDREIKAHYGAYVLSERPEKRYNN